MDSETRWQPGPPRPASAAGDPPHHEGATASHRCRVRLLAAVVVLLSASLIFLIKYRFPIVPYLAVFVLTASLWHLRAGAFCLAISVGALALTVLKEPLLPWHKEFRELLAFTLLGLVFVGTRAVLEGLERQRRTEQRLIRELSEAVGQLRESERQQALAAQALQERNHLLRAILDSVDNGIFLVDPQGRIGFANERLGALLGLEVRDVVGQDACAAVFLPLARQCREGITFQPGPLLDELHETGDAGGRPAMGGAQASPDGRNASWGSPTRPGLSTNGGDVLPSSPLPAGEEADPQYRLIELVHPTPRFLAEFCTPVRDDAGTVLGCLYVYSDLPNREHLQALLEERVAERTRELEAAHEQLLRAERLAALGQFSATMAHELRNPLNVIKLAVHYVSAHISNPDEKLRRNLSHLNQYVDRASDIIGDLLTFSRLPPPKLCPTTVNEIVRAAIGALTVPDRVTVELSLAPDLPPVMADARQIEQAVENLGQNALQAMTEGGRLAVGTQLAGNHVEITVRDTGPGILEELRGRIFEPFFSTKVSGTGLGLPLVREIAVAHGGDCLLESAPGEGACFTLSLPLAPAATRPSAPERKATGAVSS
jgi:signal transduction histidine kinase/PAS domain-containing protein